MTRCYAYNSQAQRCEMEAGHDGLHSISVAWGDDECWTPDKGNGGFTVAPVTLPATVAPEDFPSSGLCVICDHKMHTGKCRAKDGDFDCDCATGVEA